MIPMTMTNNVDVQTATTAGRPLHIAYVGPVGSGGGVPGMSRVFVLGLLRLGSQVDHFTTAPVEELPKELTTFPNYRALGANAGWGWEWGKWYSSKPIATFISSAFFRIHDHKMLSRLLVARNRECRYDVIFQLSQQELFELGRHLAELPPIAIHPCSHAAGELRWHRRESRYARRYERWITHYLVRGILIYRAFVQRRELRKPALIIGPSQRFNELLAQDYGVDIARTAVLRHPLLVAGDERAKPIQPEGKILLSAVMRVSVRKGVEQIVALSKRLDDLKERVRIQVVGGGSLFSDYRGHLSDLNPAVAEYLGELPHTKMTELYDRSDGLLVPSLYEPGSLAVGEALARGVSIIASDEVGPSEVLPASVCYRFQAGNIDALEKQVRQFITDRTADRLTPRLLAREAANTLFAPERIAQSLLDLLNSVAKISSAK